jgi:hypothetical protein
MDGDRTGRAPQQERRPIESLVDLPPMTDPDWRATMDVLTELLAPALQAGKRVVMGLALQRMRGGQ